MPLGGAGRTWFVAGAVAAVAVAFGAGLAQPWASESGSARVSSGRASLSGLSRDRARGEGGEGDACAGDTVRGIAARNGLLVAVGARAVPPEPGDDYCDARLKLWRSGDATTWEPVEPSGLAVTDALDTVAADTSGFLALLARLPGRGRGR